MAIDAVISAVTVIQPDACDFCKNSGRDPETKWDECPRCHGAADGKPRVHLHLQKRKQDIPAGQTVLTLLNPPTTDLAQLQSLVGVEIWGASTILMRGNKPWARRFGYTKIELIAPTVSQTQG